MAGVPTQKVMTPGPRRCATCQGKKTVTVIRNKGTAAPVTEQHPCPACRGTGVGLGLMTK